MADVKKIATRESYGHALEELGAEYPQIVVLDADLKASTRTEYFAAKYPDRFYDCGIAEGNMMAVAAGLATTGKIPFASTFAMFAAGRAYEQVRNSIGYPHLNVKIGATHAGITVGEDGASHQCLEDIALMRVIPGMVVLSPSDDVEARACVRAAAAYEGPVYMRFGRYAVPVFNDPDMKFEIGRGQLVKEGRDVTIVATGICVAAAIDAAKILESEGISAEIMSESLDVVIRGTEEQLAQLAAENIRAVADLTDYKESTGPYMVPAKIYVDGFIDVGAVGDYQISVNLQRP